MNEANNPQVEKWNELLDKLRKLDIVASATWDTFPSGKYISDVTVYDDVNLRSLHYETDDLQDMIEELEVYYLRAKNKDKSRNFWDGVSSVWWAWISAYVLINTVAWIVIPIFIVIWFGQAGLLPEIIEAIMERMP